jgi:polyhydroxyalkanoate synthesis regulator phasin
MPVEQEVDNQEVVTSVNEVVDPKIIEQIGSPENENDVTALRNRVTKLEQQLAGVIEQLVKTGQLPPQDQERY